MVKEREKGLFSFITGVFSPILVIYSYLLEDPKSLRVPSVQGKGGFSSQILKGIGLSLQHVPLEISVGPVSALDHKFNRFLVF